MRLDRLCAMPMLLRHNGNGRLPKGYVSLLPRCKFVSVQFAENKKKKGNILELEGGNGTRNVLRKIDEEVV